MNLKGMDNFYALRAKFLLKLFNTVNSLDQKTKMIELLFRCPPRKFL